MLVVSGTGTGSITLTCADPSSTTLPPSFVPANASRTAGALNKTVYTVMSDGTIQFEFKGLGLNDLKMANEGKAPESLLGWCYSENKNPQPYSPLACGAE